MSEKYKEIVKKVDASFEANDMEEFLSFCADDFEWKMVGDTTKKGKETVREWMSSMGEGMEPPKITARKLIAEDETVASYGEMTMKDEKGEENTYEFCDVYQFENDKIISLTSYVIKTNK